MPSCTSNCSLSAFVVFTACLELFCTPGALADFPTEVAAHEVDAIARRYDCEKIQVDTPATSLLLLPRANRDNTDGKYHQPYRAACHVYVPDVDSHATATAGYSQRFLVYGAAQDSKPEMIRAARLLLILWDEEHTRLHHDHSPDEPTVQVWLSEQRGAGLSPDTGGEQFMNQIYIYDVLRVRQPIEWAREVAHEYGHYALPGISGFQAPEEWANGVLGERLYLKWISEDIKTGRTKGTAMPYVTPTELTEYVAKQVDPLIRRVDSGGILGLDLARRDAEGMDNYIALALYIDQFYSSAQLLSAMSYTSPAHQDILAEAPDFLNGFLASARATSNLKIEVEADTGARIQFHSVYLTVGVYTVEQRGGVSSWKVSKAGKAVVSLSAHRVRVTHSGWYSVEFEPGRGTEGSPPLLLLLARNGD